MQFVVFKEIISVCVLVLANGLWFIELDLDVQTLIFYIKYHIKKFVTPADASQQILSLLPVFNIVVKFSIQGKLLSFHYFQTIVQVYKIGNCYQIKLYKFIKPLVNESIIGEYKITYPLLLINESNIKGELEKKINMVANEHDKG